MTQNKGFLMLQSNTTSNIFQTDTPLINTKKLVHHYKILIKKHFLMHQLFNKNDAQ